MKSLYEAKAGSPGTTLASSCTASSGTLVLSNASVLPDGGGIAVLGVGDNFETITYTGKSGNTLIGVNRGIEGSAAAWEAGTPIARLFTAYDFTALQERAVAVDAALNGTGIVHSNGQTFTTGSLDTNDLSDNAVTPEKTNFVKTDYVIENITSNVNPGTVNPETGEVEMTDKQNQVSDYIRVDRTKRFYLKADTCTVYEYKDNAYLGKQAQIIPREVGSNPEFDYEVRFQDEATNQIIIQCPMGKWFLLEPYTVDERLQMPNLVVDGNQLDDGTVTEGKLSEAVQTKLNTPGGLTEVNTGDIIDAAVTMPKLGEDVKAELSGIHVLTQRDGKWYDRQGVWYGLDESALTATIVGNEYTGANNGHVVLPVAVSANDQIYTVTRIVDMAFRSCLALKSLEICSRISSISMQTFGECSNLKSVSLPDSLTEIGNGAFYQCSIPSVTVPRGVTSIADYAFDGNAATLYIDNCEGEVNIGIWNGNQVYLRMKPNNYYTKTETDSRIEGNWRKITEMTLAEAAVVSVTADAENQPFSLKRFTITVTKPGVEGDTASGYLWLKSTFNNLPKPVVQSNTHSGTLGVKYRICGEMAAHWETDISSSGAQEPSDNTTAQVYRYPLGTRPEVYALGREPITNFILTWGYSDALPAGTSIEIWGMDA